MNDLQRKYVPTNGAGWLRGPAPRGLNVVLTVEAALAGLLIAILVFCCLWVMPSLNAAAASLEAQERHLKAMEEIRKAEIRNSARILAEQEEALRRMTELNRRLKEP